MGIEFRLIRSDNKTIFNLGKRLDDEVINHCFSQESLLEYLTVWQLQFWDEINPAGALLLRDRILDFVEKAHIKNLEVKPEHHDEYLIEYTCTHDRYFNSEIVNTYRDLIKNTTWEEYIANPVAFFRKHNVNKGLYVDQTNKQLAFWKNYATP